MQAWIGIEYRQVLYDTISVGVNGFNDAASPLVKTVIGEMLANADYTTCMASLQIIGYLTYISDIDRSDRCYI